MLPMHLVDLVLVGAIRNEVFAARVWQERRPNEATPIPQPAKIKPGSIRLMGR